MIVTTEWHHLWITTNHCYTKFGTHASMNWRIGYHVLDRSHPVAQGHPLSNKFWLTTKSPLEVHTITAQPQKGTQRHSTTPSHKWVEQHLLHTISHAHWPLSTRMCPQFHLGPRPRLGTLAPGEWRGCGKGHVTSTGPIQGQPESHSLLYIAHI